MTSHALELKAVCKTFGKSEIIRGANLRVPKGERCLLRQEPCIAWR